MELGPIAGPGPLNESVLVPAFKVHAPEPAVPPLTTSTSFRVGLSARAGVGVAAGGGVSAGAGVGVAAGRWCRYAARDVCSLPLVPYTCVPRTANASPATIVGTARATIPPIMAQILNQRRVRRRLGGGVAWWARSSIHRVPFQNMERSIRQPG